MEGICSPQQKRAARSVPPLFRYTSLVRHAFRELGADRELACTMPELQERLLGRDPLVGKLVTAAAAESSSGTCLKMPLPKLVWLEERFSSV